MAEHYTYTSELDSTVFGYKGKLAIRIKDGQTLKKTAKERVREQWDTTSHSSGQVSMENTYFSVKNKDPKFDDKIRGRLYDDNPRWHRNNSDITTGGNAGGEWSILQLSNSFVKKHGIHVGYKFNDHQYELDELSNIILKDKKKACHSLNTTSHKAPIVLMSAQYDVLSELMEADKKYNILSLAPRFGKTYLVLELGQALQNKVGNIHLVIASKNLSSNYSFDDSFEGSPYTFKLTTTSLFKESNDILKDMRGRIGPNDKVIIVTDEVDLASHSRNSVSKLDAIREQFNIYKMILMSGTGIYKAMKILHDVDKNDIFSADITYTELCKRYPGVYVHRNFIDVPINLNKNEMSLNIRESMSDSYHHKNICVYIHKFIENTIYVDYSGVFENLGLTDSKCTIVFINTETNKDLINFEKAFNREYPEINTECITSSSNYSNRTAERKIKKILRENPNGSLVIFCRHMASRSFSIPEIDRCILLTDGAISNQAYQAMSRCLTHAPGKESADIIRISTSGANLAEDLYLQENKHANLANKNIVKHIVEFAVTHNSFTVCHLNSDGRCTSIQKHNQDDGFVLLDKMLKFRTSRKFIINELYGLDIEFGDMKSSSKYSKQKSNLQKKNKKDKSNNSFNPSDGIERTKNEERQLEYYLDLIRVIPTYANEFLGCNSINDLVQLDEDEWYKHFSIEKDIFERNLEIDEFNSQIDNQFDYIIKKHKNDIDDDLMEYDVLYNS